MANDNINGNTGTFDEEMALQIARNNGDKDIEQNLTKSNVEKNMDTQQIGSARSASLQARATQQDENNASGAVMDKLYSAVFSTNDFIPPWWTPKRDRYLYELWHSSNLFSGAMYAMTSKMTTIPFHIEARDMSITDHVKQAAQFENRIKQSADFGKGWGDFFSMQVESLLGQDNGRFMEILDSSPRKSEPVIGPVISIAHLDSSRCTRTSNIEFPVTYRRLDGKTVKLHYTRVAFQGQLPSSKIDMYGVGYSAVSRSTHYIQNMIDIHRYKEEKLGSRPLRALMLLGGGLSPKGVGQSIELAQGQSNNANLQRFARTPIIGAPEITDPSIELIELSSLPDGFDEKDSTTIAMAAIALAIGVDARELWPAMQKSSTRADALLSHIKQRGKGPGHILTETERMFNNWVLPTYLKMVFDFQDDAQDRQKAEIRQQRSKTRKIDTDIKVTNIRVERERMLKNDEINVAQFGELELENGRLQNGRPLETIFFVDEPMYTEILSLSVSNPLDLLANDSEKMLKSISTQLTVAYKLSATETRQKQVKQIKESIAALNFLKEEYEMNLQAEKLEEQQLLEEMEATPQSNPESEKPIQQRPDDEQNLASENNPREFTGKELTGKKLLVAQQLLVGQEVNNMNLKQAFRKVTKRNVDTPQQMILKGLEEIILDSIPEPQQPIINVEPIIEVHMPPQIEQPIVVNVEQPQSPEITINVPETPPITVSSPDITVIPPDIIPPDITVTPSDVIIEKSEKEENGKEKYEVIDIKRNAIGEIKQLIRKKK